MSAPAVGSSDGRTAIVTGTLPPRSPEELLRDAWAIRKLLDDLDADDHDVRVRLLLARDELRLEAARQWRERGWRPITDEF